MSPRSGTRIPTRGGTIVMPAEKAIRALPRASSMASTSSNRSTSSRLRERSSRTPGHDKALMRELLRNGKLVTLMLGHLTVDSYVGVIPVLYPVLIGRFHLSLATVGLVSLAYSGTAAISQPLFGVIADRYGTRFTGVALAWTALTFALVGFVPSFPLLVALACASGLGAGAFHPFGALVVRALLQPCRRSVGMSGYVTPGTIEAPLVPLIGIGLLAVFRLHVAVRVPAVLRYRMLPGAWAFAAGILIGFPAASTAPVVLVMAQQLMGTRAGLPSGLVMALGFVTGAIGVHINGAIADAVGLQKSL